MGAMRPRAYGVSDTGQRRENNEDSFRVAEQLGVFVVADGVGGNSKGEVASSEAVDAVLNMVRHQTEVLERYRRGKDDETIDSVRRVLESAVQGACYMVHGMGELDPGRRGMSTTLSALLVVEDLAVVAQVGDSRIYRIRGGTCEQLTEDHTLVNLQVKAGLLTPEQARVAHSRNVITRAVGHLDYVEVDTLVVKVQGGDRFVLCTDGLHGYMEADEIYMVAGKGPVPAVAERLVEIANQRGGRDNITAVVVEVA
jgi:protein phosphatase